MPKKFIRSYKYAQAGIQHALRTQRNLWIHLSCAILALLMAGWLKVSLLECAVLVLAIFGVLVTEVLNTSIEELVNILSPEHRVEAGLAKNLGAAAVLMAAVGSAIIGALIFVPRIIK